MKVCSKCGTPSTNDAGRFCNKCGGEMLTAPAPTPVAAAPVPPVPNNVMKRHLGIFVEATESFVCALGNGFMQSILSGGGLQSKYAIVSNKRLYYRGKCYAVGPGQIRGMEEERVIDLKDVTGTGYRRNNPIGLVILGILLSLILFVTMNSFMSRGSNTAALASAFMPAILFIALYFVLRMTLFDIQYAGGQISINVKWYSKGEIDEFHRQLRLAKEQVSPAAPKL